ncbi:garvicin Q family class II bacteriocin [Streptococcus sobrinus]|uniref:garvicin Q family class II bacteriocin n=1 Tax=Streptococcus sobrinus TaxID=1310 RepID=UPI0002FCA37B|nr:garvicin Q family class II bacteriocin [Streptococcus sobrinus]
MNTVTFEEFATVENDNLAAVAGGERTIFMECANGYSYRDENGHWGYQVTKSPLEAATNTIVNSWASGIASFAAY